MKYLWKKYNLYALTITAICLFSASQAQLPVFQWGLYNGGGNMADKCIDHSPDGHIYMAGLFSGTQTFGSGPGATTITAGPGPSPYFPGADIYITKSDTAGNLIWVRQIGGKQGETITCIGYSPDGSVVVGGHFKDTITIGASSGSPKLIANGASDMFLCKYDASGNLLWGLAWGGMNTYDSDESISSIGFDDSANIIITGYFKGAVDFDPAAGNTTLTNYGTSQGPFVSKFRSDGTHLWAVNAGNINSTDGANGGQGNDIDTDKEGNIYVTGAFKGKMNFDISGQGYYLAIRDTQSQLWNAFIWKMTREGKLIWAKPLTSKSANNFNLSHGNSIIVHNNSDLYVSGYFRDTVDFDPDPQRVHYENADTAHSGQGGSAFVLKLDTAAGFKWVRYWGAPSRNFTIARDMAVDPLGNVYTAGEFHDTMDFDPGAGTFILSPPSPDMTGFVSKLDCSGNFVWAGNVEAASSWTYINGVAVDEQANVFLGGYVVFPQNNPLDIDPTSGVFQITGDPAAFTLSFMTRLSDCPAVTPVDTILGETKICKGKPYIYSVAASCDVLSYTWELPQGMTGSSSGDQIEITAYEPGIIRVRANGLCDSTGFTALSVVMAMETPEIDVNGDILSTTEPYQSYQWLKAGIIEPGATNRTYTVTENGSYRVIVTDAGGCSDTSDVYKINNVSVTETSDNITISVSPNPAAHTVYITSNIHINISLTDMQGRLITAKSSAGSLPLNGIADGVYMIRITDDKGRHLRTQKLIIKK